MKLVSGRLVPCLAALLAIAFVAAGFSTSPAIATRRGAWTAVDEPDVVIAFIDEGINPYHAAFRDERPRAYEHPSTYLDGYPLDAVAVNLTFVHASLADALAADCEAWEQLEPGTLYWFPGTRIVGAIFVHPSWVPTRDFYPGQEFSCDAAGESRPMFIDRGSHGTLVASRGAGNPYGACADCLIVLVHSYHPLSSLWAAEQPWIDLQSNSWAMEPVAGTTPASVRMIEEASARQPSFWASYNLPVPTQAQPALPPSAIRVGGHDNGHVIHWPGSSPHVVSDSCWNWAAQHGSLSGWTPRTGSGTSSSTPFATGIAALLVREARTILGDARNGVRDGVLAEGPAGIVSAGPLADGNLTLQDLRDVLYATADPRPEPIPQDGDVCEPAENPAFPTSPIEFRSIPKDVLLMPLIGYGAVTPQTAATAREVLRGDLPIPLRPAEDDYFRTDDVARLAAYEAYQRSPDPRDA